MKPIIIFFSFIIVFNHAYCNSQSDSLKLNKNHLSLEIAGVGVYGSVNYERLILANSYNKLIFRVGFSYIPSFYNNKTDIGTPLIPLGAYYLICIKKTKHHIVFGLSNSVGYTFSKYDKSDDSFHYLLSPSIGYRYENFFKKSFFFNIDYSPVFYYSQVKQDSKGFNKNWGQAGIGYSF